MSDKHYINKCMHGKREEDDGDGDNEKEDEELVTWLEYPIEDPFEKTYCRSDHFDNYNSIELPWPYSLPSTTTRIQANPNITRRKCQESSSTTISSGFSSAISSGFSSAISSGFSSAIENPSCGSEVNTREVVGRKGMGSNLSTHVSNVNNLYNIPTSDSLLLQRSISAEDALALGAQRAAGLVRSNPVFNKVRTLMQPQQAFTNPSITSISTMSTNPSIVTEPTSTKSRMSDWTSSSSTDKSGLVGRGRSRLASMRSNSMPDFTNKSLLHADPSMQDYGHGFPSFRAKAPTRNIIPKPVGSISTSCNPTSTVASREGMKMLNKVPLPCATSRSASFPPRNNSNRLVRKINDPTMSLSPLSSECYSFLTEETLPSVLCPSTSYMSSGSNKKHLCTSTQTIDKKNSSIMMTSEAQNMILATQVSQGPSLGESSSTSSYAGPQANALDSSSRDERIVVNRKTDGSEFQSELKGYGNDESMEKKQHQGSSSLKRNRAAEVHNLSERNRRNRINEKLKALQELIPNSTKTDKASVLDDAIEYMKTLQMHLQMISMRSEMNVSPLMIPVGMPHLQMGPIPNVGLGIGMPVGHPHVGNMGNLRNVDNAVNMVNMDMYLSRGTGHTSRNPYETGFGTSPESQAQVSSNPEFRLVEATPIECGSPQVASKLPEGYNMVQLGESQEQGNIFKIFP